LPTINGEAVPIDQPAIIIEGMTFAPLRFLAEAFGASVEWEGSRAVGRAIITSSKADN
jgi:hypothetical protein